MQMTIKPIVIWCTLSGCILALCSWLVHPFGRVKNIHSEGHVLSGASIDVGTKAIIRRSCQNCHSERTEWPWYGYVAPVSWLVEDDVQRARSLMNLSRWQAYSTERKLALLGEIEMMTKNRLMPPSRYLLLHREARLSDVDIKEVSMWARAERARLQSSPSSFTGVGGHQ